MEATHAVEQKRQVRAYWDANVCGTEFSAQPRYTREYFEEIERHRYAVEPEIPPFARFEEARGRRVLEVGIGAATDFLQWVRAGAQAHGVDLTAESIRHARRRLAAYGLAAADLRVADCESLPHPDDSFDLVYSWGVIHHTPDTPKAMREIVRVTRPGGSAKVMIYNRRSLKAFYLWATKALLRGRPWKSFAWCLARYMESAGTKAYTPREARAMLAGQPVQDVRVRAVLSHYDRLGDRPWPVRGAARLLAAVTGGDRRGWFLLVEFTKAPPAAHSALR